MLDHKRQLHRSRHCNQGNFFIELIAPDSLRARIQRRPAIDDKKVMVMTVVQLQLSEPIPIKLLLHRMGRWIPVIEITHNEHLGCAVGIAVKIDGFEMVLGRVTRRPAERFKRIHVSSVLSWRSEVIRVRKKINGQMKKFLTFSSRESHNRGGASLVL